MSLYSRFVLAPLINCACGCKMINDKRALIVPQARGVVLELGAGPGYNLQFYDPAIVSKVIAVEPEQAFEPAFRKAARQTPIDVELRLETAEQMNLPPHSVDTILATFVLCTIPDGVSALKAAKRALRPNGRLIFCEHGLAPQSGADAETARPGVEVDLWRMPSVAARADLDRERRLPTGGAGQGLYARLPALCVLYVPRRRRARLSAARIKRPRKQPLPRSFDLARLARTPTRLSAKENPADSAAGLVVIVKYMSDVYCAGASTSSVTRPTL